MRHLSRFFLLAWLCLAACAEREHVATPTQVTVRITSNDDALLSRMTHLRMRASLRVASGWKKPDTDTIDAKGLVWPVDLPVLPPDPSVASQFEVVVEALGPNGVLAQARALRRFAPGFRLIVELPLYLCPGQPEGSTCEPNSDCHGESCLACTPQGSCVPVGSAPETGAFTQSEAGVLAGGEAGVDSEGGVSSENDGSAPGMDAGDAAAGSIDSGPPAPEPECDAMRACSEGYLCMNAKCVSLCTQTQCDPNATCALSGAKAVCSCNTGYVAMPGMGSEQVRCVKDVACTELKCDTNATCEVGMDQLRHCICKPGYTGTGMMCTPVSCEALTITHGTGPTMATYGQTATYKCDTGYVLYGGTARKCEASGKWSGTAPTCIGVDCGSPTIGHGRAVATPGTRYPATATYSCDTGLTLTGTATRTCEATGRWSGTAPRCVGCGDGTITAPETCDPEQFGVSFWTCNDADCQRTKLYNACTGEAGSCDDGQECINGMCTTACSASMPCRPPPSRSGVRATCNAEPGQTGYCEVTCATSLGCQPTFSCYSRKCAPCRPDAGLCL